MNILPSVQELETDGRTKRWGFVNYSMTEVINFANNEIAILIFRICNTFIIVCLATIK